MTTRATDRHEPRGGESCACTDTRPCGLHYVDHTGNHPRPERRRRYFCRVCHTSADGVSCPDGWFRIQVADQAQERERHYLFATRGLYCSPQCLLVGAARLLESHPTDPEHAARLHEVTELAGRL